MWLSGTDFSCDDRNKSDSAEESRRDFSVLYLHALAPQHPYFRSRSSREPTNSPVAPYDTMARNRAGTVFVERVAHCTTRVRATYCTSGFWFVYCIGNSNRISNAHKFFAKICACAGELGVGGDLAFRDAFAGKIDLFCE